MSPPPWKGHNLLGDDVKDGEKGCLFFFFFIYEIINLFSKRKNSPSFSNLKNQLRTKSGRTHES